MTTTAHEDQFTVAPEPARQQYSTADILRRNVADLELALKQQTERAEAADEKLTTAREDMQSWIDSRNGWMERAGAAEAELAKLREQEPVAWMHDKDGRVDTCHDSVKELWIKVGQKQNTQFMREIVPCRVEHYNIPLYAAPVPAPAVPKASDRHVCGLQGFGNSLDDVCPACAHKHQQIIAPAVPAPAAPEEWRNIVTEMLGWWDDPAMTMSQGKVIAEKARALMQSAEVKK